MLSAIKKLASRQDAAPSMSPNTGGNGSPNSGVATPNAACTPMAGSLQRRFAKGVQYNMKIIIKGDRNVGKSCLLERLQGKSFIETYSPSDEINVASIQWSFKATEDVVKVEVWDVVDRGKARQRPTGLKISTAAPIAETPALDAEFLDVYKGTHGVILMLDITKNWTFEYACKELPKIPSDIPVLLLGNHCDMAHHRVISPGQAHGLIEGLPPRQAEVLYGESSMRNGFGLRLLHKFLGLPFLHLQKETLLAQLERNQRDAEVCTLELNAFLNSTDADYNAFLDNLVNKRRQVADSNPKNFTHFSGPAMSSSTANHSPISANTLNGAGTSKSIIIGAGQPIVVPNQRMVTADQPNMALDVDAKQTVKVGSSKPTAWTQSMHTRSAAKVTSLEEFCPEDETLDKSFLDESPAALNQAAVSQARRISYDSDSDGNETVNPLVAQFHDDPGDMDAAVPASPNASGRQPATGTPWQNPLAMARMGDPLVSMMDAMAIRRNSLSSDDTEVPTILNTTNDHSDNDDDHPIEPYDSWLSDTNQRRSPEGGEDEATITGTDKAADVSASSTKNSSLSDVDTKSDRTLDKAAKKKKKKDKKDKTDGKEKEKKKKRRSDRPEHSRRSNELLTEQIDEPHSSAEPDVYEAI